MILPRVLASDPKPRWGHYIVQYSASYPLHRFRNVFVIRIKTLENADTQYGRLLRIRIHMNDKCAHGLELDNKHILRILETITGKYALNPLKRFDHQKCEC